MSDFYSTDTSAYPSSAGSIPIDRLVKEAAPDYGVDVEKMRSGLTNVAREKSVAVEAATDRQLRASESNYAKLQEKYEGIKPLDVKPWDADRERSERIQSPLDAFGSYAGIFAMLASAFTKTPMDNALNAGAAAINSVRANDMDGYTKAYDAHKQNTDLALKRHETERQAFKDAEELYKQDPIAGGAELKAVAARFGARAELALIDSGYVPQVFEMQKAKSDAAQKLLHLAPQLADLDIKMRGTMLANNAVKEENQRRAASNLPPMSAQEQAQMVGDVQRTATQSYGSFSASKMDEIAIERRAQEIIKADPSIQPWDARLQAKQEAKDALANPATREQTDSIENAKREWLAAHPEAKGVIPASIENEIRAKAKGQFTNPRQEALAIQQRAKELEDRAAASGNPISPSQAYTQAAHQIAAEKSALTANQADKIKSHISLLDESTRVIDRVEGTIEKYVGSAGVAGRVMRVKERLSNLIGSNQTDRDHMMRDIEYLRLNAPRLLTDSPARPLAADVNRINTIVGGLEWGDTGANTLRAMEEIKDIYKRSRESAVARLNNTWSPGGSPPPAAEAGAAPSSPATKSRTPWMNDPVIK